MNISLSLILFIVFVILFSLVFYIGLKNSIANWDIWWLNSFDGWVRLFCRYFHKLDYHPIPIPETGGAIIVSNHVSGLDPFLLVAATKRPIRFLIAREEYQRFGLTWLFKAGGCIPIERSGNVIRAMSEVITALKSGEVIAIFPEGAIHIANTDKKPLKRGVALVAEASHSPIYPVHIEGVKGHGHVFRGLIFPGDVNLTPGEKIICTEDTHKECLAKITRVLHPN
ncbi:MAG: lysophospholipid acyltransferase family protein [Gammaproteobacteria bacterium]